MGSEFHVNSFTTASQQYPAIAASGSNNFLVVWESNGQDGSARGIFGQRFSAAGLPAGSEFMVNTYTTGSQSWPAVATDANGFFVVVWSGAGLTDSRGVFGQRFNSAGSTVGGEFRVNSYTTSAQFLPAVAADGLGGFVVLWGGVGATDSVGVFGRRFNSVGGPLGSDFQINAFTTGGQQIPAVAADGSGNFVVAWDSFHDGYLTGVFERQMTTTLFAGDFESADVCAWSFAVGSGDVC